MKEPSMLLRRMLRSAVLTSAMLLSTGCALLPSSHVGVSVSGVNYTDKSFAYLFKDPGNPDNTGGGESVSAFSGGGVMCCYQLPRQWKPGLQVKVRIYDDGREFVKEVIAEVPAYPNGKPGTLWAVLHADGSVEAVSSDGNPRHPDWPGKVKGWPVPTVEYRKSLLNQKLTLDRLSLLRFEQASQDLAFSPEERASFKETSKRLKAYIEYMEKKGP